MLSCNEMRVTYSQSSTCACLCDLTCVTRLETHTHTHMQLRLRYMSSTYKYLYLLRVQSRILINIAVLTLMPSKFSRFLLQPRSLRSFSGHRKCFHLASGDWILFIALKSISPIFHAYREKQTTKRRITVVCFLVTLDHYFILLFFTNPKIDARDISWVVS